jgi:hypothetical protein
MKGRTGGKETGRKGAGERRKGWEKGEKGWKKGEKGWEKGENEETKKTRVFFSKNDLK